ncbi:ATP-binding protein [Streptomyces ficellus]|uniref:ATP-binding protein n=2 Tax=Streptomyces ficellus TaxID=1977088 RepID=A0A6I6FRJ1_9ACTN|nr:ATP-binding protein [Streptomyces ficellus]QGV82385.1 ATP-binding protein [Streptomyces ficellus]
MQLHFAYGADDTRSRSPAAPSNTEASRGTCPVTAHTSALSRTATDTHAEAALPRDEGLGAFAACGLGGCPRSAGQARGFVRATLTSWALPSLVPDMSLIVSELVTNAVQHGLDAPASPPSDNPVWLGLFRYPGVVVCAVSDPSSEPPRPRAAHDSAGNGRGLALVGALSESWSWDPAPVRGKTVWASVALPGGQA